MPAATLMIQGTASSVGKSLLVTALCRIFKQDGLRVAPFKSQNMALNSAVTPDGREIGRAQAAQALAAGVPPEVAMNPILLKPEGDRRSQVVVLGRPWGVMDALEYHDRKGELIEIVQHSLESLRERFDLVVIEGAGSPAEINLMDRDLVNMRVAQIADAPVILTGDIDRGGVFAAIIGTLDLLGQHRDRVAGFVINKFRGSLELLEPGLEYLRERTGRPVFGVIPFLPDLRLEAEDSLEVPETEEGEGPLVAIVRFPFISNFDEFRYLSAAGLAVRYVERPAQLEGARLIVLPGSKSVRHDLAWLRDRDLAEALIRKAADGVPVLGICGGYEMLGTAVRDPDGCEGEPGQSAGLELLPLVTTFNPDKTTQQVVAEVGAWLPELRGVSLAAYEIHMGQAVGPGDSAFAVRDRSGGEPRAEGQVCGTVVGTFLHGLFENPEFCRAIARRLGAQANGPLEPAYDRLADHMRRHLDLPALYHLVERTGKLAIPAPDSRS